MPSSATITAFYNFTANTKARATQVNANFDVLRGHLVAIDPNTATAATTETYDLGSTEYRWRTGYFREVDLKSNTTTGQALQIVGDTAAGQGAFLLKHGGNIRARIGGGNQYIDLDTTTSQFDFKVAGSTIGTSSPSKWVSSIATSTGQWDFLRNGSTVTSIKTSGFQRNVIAPTTFFEAAMVTTGAFSIATVGSSNLFLISTLSVTSNNHSFMVGMNLKMPQTTGTIYINLENTITTAGFANIYIYRDGTAVTDLIGKLTTFIGPKATTTSSTQYVQPRAWTIDPSCSAGGHTYYCYAAVSSGLLFFQQGCVFQAMEIL